MKINPTKTVSELINTVSYVTNIEGRKNIYHAWRVAILSAKLARKKTDPRLLKYIFYSALLHDIGGVGFPYHIIHYLKRNDKTSRNILLSHPIIGAQLVSNIPQMNEIAKLILDHHEWVNGGGYPRAKTKNNIPAGSQIIRIADAIDILLDIVKPNVTKEGLFKELRLNLNNFTFALLPGSREKEVKTLLPIMLDTAFLIHKAMGDNIQFLILRSPTVKEDLFKSALTRYKKLPVHLISGKTYDGLASSDFALVASGTATLETAILGIPMVILYKVSFSTWAYLRMKIRIPYIGLVNVVKGGKIIEEFIQYNARPRKIADYIIKVLKDKEKLNRIREGLTYVSASLGEKGASIRAAEIVVDCLTDKNENKSY